MVCIPCIVAPVLLFLWYRFIQPIVLRIWSPWATQKSVKSAQTNTEVEGEKSCPFAKATETTVTTNPDEGTVKDSATKKSD